MFQQGTDTDTEIESDRPQTAACCHSEYVYIIATTSAACRPTAKQLLDHSPLSAQRNVGKLYMREGDVWRREKSAGLRLTVTRRERDFT